MRDTSYANEPSSTTTEQQEASIFDAYQRQRHPRWRPEPGYHALHHRLRTVLGRPRRCEVCGMTDPSKRYEWALMERWVDPANLRVERGMLYSLSPADYESLCLGCHVRQRRTAA